MRKRRFPYFALVLAGFSVCASCSLFRNRPAPYPTGLQFPLDEDGSLTFKGRPVGALRGDSGLIVFVTEGGLVYGVDPAGRRVIWTFQAEHPVSFEPCLDSERIVLSDESSTVFALNRKGELLGKRKLNEKISVPPRLKDGLVYLGTEKGSFLALDPGRELKTTWRYSGTSAVRTTPAFAPGLFLFGTDDGRIQALNGAGRPVWSHPLKGKVRGALLADEGAVYFGTDDHYFSSLRLQNQKPGWRLRLGGDALPGSMILGKRLYVVAANSVLYCLNKRSGEIVWWQAIRSKNALGILSVEDKIAVSTLAQEFEAFAARTGAKAGEYKAVQEVKASGLWLDPVLALAFHDMETDEGKLTFLKKAVRASIASSKPSPQARDEEIVLSASAVGFHLPRYEFYLKTGETREVVQKESEKNVWTWFPEKEGSYIIGVVAKDERQTREAETAFVIQKKPEVNQDKTDQKKEDKTMNREQALELLKKHLKNKNLIKHCLAVEACMRAMAARLGQDPESWGLAGVVHDLDYELTEKSPELHTTETVRILKEMGIAEPVIQAVQAHAGKVPCQTPMDWAIYSIDPLTGLIIAATLMHPEKKLKSIDLEFVKRRYKEKSFAKGARREEIEESKNLGLELDEFIGICLKAMQGIDKDLGLG